MRKVKVVAQEGYLGLVWHHQQHSVLIRERNTAELVFLKSQGNPHFLFNTLNNSYLNKSVLPIGDIYRESVYRLIEG